MRRCGWWARRWARCPTACWRHGPPARSSDQTSVPSRCSCCTHREIRSPALKELLQELRGLAYNADDVLDELDYFRIQDELEGTYEVADRGCIYNLVRDADHMTRAVGKQLHISPCSSAAHGGNPYRLDEATRRWGICGAWPCKAPRKKTPKLDFDRVDLSRRMKNIVEQLQPLCANVSTILDLELLGSAIHKLELLGSSHGIGNGTSTNRSITTSQSTEAELVGRDSEMNSIIEDITKGEYFQKDITTVLPIVGPGGIGKTTLTQYIYNSSEVQEHFQIRVWICVSLDFSVYRLTQEIAKCIPKAKDEKNWKDGEPDGEPNNLDQLQKLIEKKLKNKRFLLVLDNIWKYGDEEWKKLLLPFTKGQVKGNIVLVSTRFLGVAEMVRTTNRVIHLYGLKPEEFWSFFLTCVFGETTQQSEGSALLCIGKQIMEKLHCIGKQIVEKLKGSPLAAKTVGRLLRNNLTLDHWTRVLESKEWESQTGDHDIMPALKLSYDYLSFPLQQCFAYCALFPEDYKFDSEELIRFWIGLDILCPGHPSKRIEDTGLDYLDDLVNYGFFKRETDEQDTYYIIHDLLHDLALKVSSQECLSIDSSRARHIDIAPSICHLSINMSSEDIISKQNFKENFRKALGKIGNRLKYESLHTLMLFGEYDATFVGIFSYLFKDTKFLRVVHLSRMSYPVESILPNFSKLVHLRYLKLGSTYVTEIHLPSSLSRFYHLRILDIRGWHGVWNLPGDLSNLVKLRHFIVPNDADELHFNISNVESPSHPPSSFSGAERKRISERMEVAVSAARWVVGKALGLVTDGLLEAWAASAGLGPNVDMLKMELLYAQGMLDNAQGRDVRNPAHKVKELFHLHKLRRLAYDADDVLDELDYFRIQDELDGTYHAADVHAGGCIHGLGLNARHTARAVASKLKLSSCSRDASRGDPDGQEDDAKQGCLSGVCSCGAREISSTPPPATDQGVQEVDRGCMPKVASSARDAAHAAGKHFPCYSFPSVHDDAHTGTLESSNVPVNGRRFLCGAWTSKARQRDRAVQTPKLKFDRVEMSRKMKDIVEQLKPVCAKVCTILNLELLGPTTQDVAMNRPKTTPAIIEPRLYGRDSQKKSIADSITHGEYCAKELTVLPIVGPGGIGKTTFTQHLYEEVKSHFQVPVWICVSLDFNANRLLQEIVKKIPEVNGEKRNCSEEELIEQRLQSKRFLLVLDDMWTYHEDEWKKLLAPFKKGGIKGNMIIVTTRIPEVANMVRTIDCSIELERLSPEDIMCFFEACVFDDQQPWKDYDVLREVGREIVARLKGFPLAAKTVGRLLRNQLTLDHWIRVLDSKEWELQTNDDDIMPALKLSYDYLPFHLQQCFSYCALFHEDYEFNSEELIHLWIGLGLLDTCGQIKRIEDIGLSYLNDLGNHGFFKKEEKANGSHYYVIHGLLHELATKVSSYECLSIRSSNVRSIQIPPSIRHVSIIIEERDVSDRMTFEDCKRDLSTLDKRLKVENLRTLMLFGEYHGSFAKTFGDLFREAKALRVILLSKAYYTVEDVLHNFSKFLHLRYLRIATGYYSAKVSLYSTIARFYHLRVLDLKQCSGHFGFPRDMSNLVKLRHFLVRDNKVHSSIFEVGKLISLQELRSFMVMKENKGFELRQIGQLVVVGGSLGIYNLENVKGKEEAHEAKLIHKNHLHELILGWDINRSSKDPTREEHVLESLKPHSNLRELRIRGHGGTNCPTWLDVNFSTKRLESLCLEDVAWNKLPPLGELWVVDERGDECRGCIAGQSFDNLKRLELVKIPRLKKWVGNGPCHLFSHLEVLIIKDCSELMELPFSRSTCCQPQQEANMTWFPRLRELEIVDCPKLLSLPPIPWTRSPCSFEIARTGSGFEQLVYSQDYRSGLKLKIEGNGGQDSVFWKVLAFYNLAELKELEMENCLPLPLDHLQMLTSLKIMKIHVSSNVLSPVPSESNAIYQFPVEHIEIFECGASGKELTQLFSHFPKLTKLSAWYCEKITVLGVVEQQTATPASSPSSPANKMDDAEIGEKQRQTRRGEEIAAGGGLLLLPPQLQELEIYGSPELSLRTNSLDDDTARGGLQSLHSLRSLQIRGCPKFLSSSSGFPFPTSLQQLTLHGVEGMETLAPLSNLISLTKLFVSSPKVA